MTTRTDPTAILHPVLAGFLRQLLDSTSVEIERVYRPGKPIGGTWRVDLSNGVALSAYYGRGIGGCYWHAILDGEQFNLCVAPVVDRLRERILEGVGA